jgi:hypothetical protein
VSLALATAIAGTTAHAANLSPGANNELPVGGATASDLSLARGWLRDLCDPATTPAAPGSAIGNTIEVFTTNNDFLGLVPTGGGTTKNYAIACRTKATVATGAQSTDVVMLKYSGGSSTGVTPVANNATLSNSSSAQWTDVAGCRDAGGNPTGSAIKTDVAAGGGLPGVVIYSGCANGSNRVPKAGLSDLEARLIVSGGGSLPLDTLPGASIPMGIAVSENFVGALARAQGLTDANGNNCWTLDASGNPHFPLSKYTPECTPSLARSQIAGFYTGNIQFVGQFEDQSGAAIPNPPAGNAVRFCRRGTGSGTFRTHTVNILGQFCGSQRTMVNSSTFSGGTAWVDTFSARVFAGTGNADVQDCLDDAAADGQYAIGTLSLEANNFNDTDQRWRFIKLEGKFPSLENVNRARYDFFADSACNRPADASANDLSPVQAALASGTVDASGNAVGLCGALRGEVVAVNPSGTFSWLLGTLNSPLTAAAATDPTAGSQWTQADVITNPTNVQTHSQSYGAAPNNCNPPWTTITNTAAVDDKENVFY